MAKRRATLEVSGSGSLSSLGDLLRARGVATGAAAPAPAAAAASAPADGEADLAGSVRIVVRRERKGHGGKTVTVIDGLALAPAALEEVARALRRAFGCGGRVDGGTIGLQGDRLEAAAAWLRAHGARRVIRGN